jgi:hypothetical protein
VRPNHKRTRRCFRTADVDLRAIPIYREPFTLLEPEAYSLGGAAPKHFLVRNPGKPKEHAYIAKRPKNCGPRECATEQLITDPGKTLPIRIAHSRLVLLPDPRGRATDIRFMSRYFLRTNDEMMHGVELAEIWLDARDAQEIHELFTKTREQELELYSATNILQMPPDVCGAVPG